MDQKTITIFAGKGGVGKTTCAAATALQYARNGKRTLVISTDPTPSLADIFETTGSGKATPVTDNLLMHELGLPEVKLMWETRFGREVFEVFSSFVAIEYPDFVDFMTSILPGLGDEFMLDYIRQLSQKDETDVIIWDTAPLGQTLALLETPTLLRQHLKMAPRIYSKLKVGKQSRQPVIEILKQWEALSAANIEFLRSQVKFCTVTIAEALAVNQLKGVFAEMNKYDLKREKIIVNNLVPVDGSTFLTNRAAQQKRYLKQIREVTDGLPVIEVPLFPGEIKSLEMLDRFAVYLV
ncbi:MAG: ArsA family ATPase [Dehalococcoidales bacterium]|nr:ArsA family ATPase [Dehalococcoidales bacterium]